MFPGFRSLAWATALCWAVFFAHLLTGFRLMVEPEEAGSGLEVFAGTLCLSLMAQCGLLAAPWALSRGLVVRGVVAALMAPPALFIGLVALEAVQAFMAGRPLSALTSVLSLIGASVYGVAYVELIRTSRPWRRRHVPL